MPVRWSLKKWLAVEHDIYRPVELQRRILERTGIDISPQALGELLRRPPRQLKLSTMEALCTALQCTLNDFFEIVPGKATRRRVRRPNAAHGNRRRQNTDFPSPSAFQPHPEKE